MAGRARPGVTGRASGDRGSWRCRVVGRCRRFACSISAPTPSPNLGIRMTSPVGADSTQTPATDERRPSIAIVDDDSGFAGYLRTFLGVRGYEARSYSRGDEILAAIRQGEPPDIVLLDVAMPGMNGLQTLKALKTARPELQVIMLSGREQAQIIVEAVRLGAADYVVKPDDPEGLGEIALDAAIKQAIERSRLVNELTDLRRQLSDDKDQAFLAWGDSPP